ncbi:MAG TPA: pyridoxamine 5'-phosphate oxidase family protein [Acidimicrobiales bacterium]|jgi:nitroimidazol reductase NimA-like FMN-containing flavoprotein (pyridoxamine 5'-phosphate oxidase superfamily)|nr:pyridoxamine 5'-phosphate oxidase family protein [Acidimicrobiales bacterium]
MSVVELDRNGLAVLEREECIALLGSATVGRIAITSNALPVVLPVNFVLLDDRIVIRTSRGTKLDAATRNTVVAFEVDEIDRVEQTGWSVLVTGVARELVAPDEIDEVSASPPARWAPGPDGRYIAISTDMISGRRILA